MLLDPLQERRRQRLPLKSPNLDKEDIHKPSLVGTSVDRTSKETPFPKLILKLKNKRHTDQSKDEEFTNPLNTESSLNGRVYSDKTVRRHRKFPKR